MDVREFGEAQWREVLEDFRLLVQRAGFAEWDLAMVNTLDEGDDPGERGSEAPQVDWSRPAHHQLLQYTDEFTHFLKSRSRATLEEHRRSLGRLLHTVDGAPVEGFTVVFDEREHSLYERTDEVDAMIEELSSFRAEINGETTEFWTDEEPDDPRDER